MIFPLGGGVGTGIRIPDGCPLTRRKDLPSALEAADGFGATTVAIDVEPLVAQWRTTDTDLESGVDAVSELTTRYPNISNVMLLTNSARRLSGEALAGTSMAYVARACKPWRRHGLDVSTGALAVIGDQLLTDGLLAWRCRHRPTLFVEVHDCSRDAPLWPALQRWAATPLRNILFSPWERP